MGKRISIIGLGWLGLPLAKALKAESHQVKGTVTMPDKALELQSQNMDASVLTVSEQGIEISNESIFECDILIINFPPERTQNIEEIYPAQVQHIIPYIEKHVVSKVIFISSTSVYPEINTIVTENKNYYPRKTSGLACLKAEKVLQGNKNFETTVIRFGGLIGADRNPHRFMKRGERNGHGHVPVNLIHIDDCIGIIKHIISRDIWDETINGCCPIHPTREGFYKHAASIAGIEFPLFDNSALLKFKIVSSNKIIRQFGYDFKYKSPNQYLQSLAK